MGKFLFQSCGHMMGMRSSIAASNLRRAGLNNSGVQQLKIILG
jgi:hypothetical protein